MALKKLCDENNKELQDCKYLMEKQRISEISAYSRRWGAISLLENVANFRKFKESREKTQIPKRINTDFFPNRFKGRKRYKEKSRFIISPESRLKITWDIIKLIIIMTEAILIPFILSFCPSPILIYQYVLSSTELFFFIDIVFKFNTEIYFNGILFSNRIFIARQYLKSSFFFDILAVFPYNLLIPEVNLQEDTLYIPVSEASSLRFLWLIKLIRISELKKLIYKIEDFFVSSFLLTPIQGLSFFFTVFFWTNLLACIVYVFFARSLELEPVLWNFYYEKVEDRYLRNIYLILQTMTSVGYGDILPKTPNQRIVAAISMCFACVLFGDIIGNIQGYIENYDADNKYYESTARRLKNHLKKHNLPPMLRHRVIQYIYYLQRISKNNDPKEMGILDNLSTPLREEIFTQTRGYLLAKSVVFNCYSGSFLKYLGHQMKIEAFATGDIIFKEGDPSTVIYYLCSGKVQIYHEKTKTVFKDIKKSKYFGEIAFFLGDRRTASAACLEFAEFLTLDRSSLFNVLNSRPKEKEITNVIIHNIRKYKNLALLGIRCYLCKKVGHVATTCKRFVYIVDQKEVIKKAEARKYMNRKTVNINSKSGFNYERQDILSDPLKRFDLVNTKGEVFSPYVKYSKHQKIINRALSITGKNSNRLNIDRLLSIKEGCESEENEANQKNSHKSFYSIESIQSGGSDLSSGSDKSVTFGK